MSIVQYVYDPVFLDQHWTTKTFKKSASFYQNISKRPFHQTSKHIKNAAFGAKTLEVEQVESRFHGTFAIDHLRGHLSVHFSRW